jgi:hypothetical protein
MRPDRRSRTAPLSTPPDPRRPTLAIMGFGREARRVRDHELLLNHRFHALGSCIQLAQPIGFNATWSYLADQLERDWRDPGILSPAIDLLEAERVAHRGICSEYAVSRHLEKARGLRFPPRSHVTPRDPMRWHGDEREGARHVLMSWSSHRRQLDQDVLTHPLGRQVVNAVEEVLRSEAAITGMAQLQPALEWARRQVHVIGWEADPLQYRIALRARGLLGQLHLLAFGATPVAAPWNFAKSE